MAQLRQDYDQFVERDAEVVVIGPDKADAFARYWEKEALPFIGLPDPKHQVADLYGQQVKLLKLGRMPALLVIDQQGDIRFRHYGGWMSDIPDNGEIFNLLDQLNGRTS
jgi:peroxiredoxin Q/BCP